MATKIVITPELDEAKLRQQLNNIENRKEKIKVDLDTGDISGAAQDIKKLNTAVSNSNTVFGKLKNTISNTFSSGKIAMTGYLVALNEIRKAARSAKDTIQELDKAVTDLSVATNMSRESVAGLVKDYNNYAKELKSTTLDITSAADDYLRAGKTMGEAKELIKDSIMLSKLGQLESGTATEDLLAVMNGYEMSIEDVGKSLDAMVAIDMKAATSAGNIATALRYSASSADAAGLSFNKLSAMIATVQDKTQQSSEMIGTFMNTLLSRYRNVKIGQFVSDDGEDLSEVETILNSLDIKLRDSSLEFRDFETVIEEVALSWDNYSSVQQAAIAKAFSGVRNQNRFLALMEGYNKTLELTEVAANSAGTAVEKFNNSYMNSLEAKQNTLQASFESMIMNTDLSEVYAGILDATKALVDFINQTNALKGALTGLTVAGGIKAFLTIKTGVMEAYIALNKFQNALDITKKTSISTKEYERLLLLSNGLSTSQMRLVLSTNSLTVAQKKELLMASGLSEEEAILQLQTWKMTTANTGLTASTVSLGTALKGLWATLIANPIVIVTALVSGAVMAWQSYDQKLEKIRQKTEEAANAYKESASAIDDYASRYQELHKALLEAKGDEEETYNIKKQLLSLQTELNDKYGDEYGRINLLSDAYRDQTEAIKALNKEKAQTFLNENKEGIDKAFKEMTEDRHYNLSYTGISSYTDDGAALKEIAEKYKEQGIYLLDELENGNYAQFSIHLNTNVQSAYDTINKFENDVRAKAKELGDEHIFDDVLEISSSELNNAKEIIDSYADTFKQALTAEIVSDDSKAKTYSEALRAVEAYNEAVLYSKNPYDDQNVIRAKENLDTIKSSIQSNEEEFEKYSILFGNVFDQADTRLIEFNEAVKNDSGLQELAKDLEGLSDIDLKVLDENVGDNESFDKLKASAKEYKVKVDELIDTLIRLGYAQGEVKNSASNIAVPDFSEKLTTSQESLDKFQSSVKTAADAYSTLLSGNYSSSDLLDSIQAINKAVSDMGGSLNWEFINNNKDSINLLGDAIEYISQKYAESILSGAGIDADSDFGQMLANNIIQAQKASTQLDVLNDQIDSLQAAYSNLTDIVETYNETGSITFDQLQTLLEMEPQYLSCLVDENGQLQLNEAAMTELANKRLDDAEAQAIQQAITELGQIALQDEKTAVNENAQAFSNAVNDLAGYNAELANTIAEATVGASAIRDLNAAINGAESQGATDNQINTVLDNLNTKLQLIGNVRDKVSAGGLGAVVKSGSGSQKDTTKEFDWIEQSIENLEDEIKSLDDIVNSSYSTFSQKNEALAEEMGKVTEEIGLQQKAYEEYMRKANSIGLSDHYKELVQNGAVNIEDIKDENLQEQIDGYQKWYEKAQKASDAINDLKTDLKDLHVESYKLQTDNLKERLDNDSITEKQYLKELKATYEKYYADLTDYAQQYHEAVLDYLEEEKKYLNSVANAAASLIDREINNIRNDADEQEGRIKRQIELLEDRKKPLQDELDALNEKVRKEQLSLNLQKAQYDLAKAENQKTKLIYTADKGMIYTTDTDSIRNAQKDVDDAKLEIQKQSIQVQIDALDKEIDRYNDLIDQINKAADAQIDALEKIKNKWQEVIDQQEYAKNISLLTGEFGSDAIEKILTGNDDDLLAQWKNSYITTLADIDKESQGYIGNMTQQMASLYGIDLSPLQDQFQGVKESVDIVTNALGEAATAVGIGKSGNRDVTNKSAQYDAANSKNTSLESAIQNEAQTAVGAFDQHTDKITNEVIPAIHAATDEMNAFNAAADTDIEKTITIHYNVDGNKPAPAPYIGIDHAHSDGTAHVEGTAKVMGDWAVQSDENKALVGEVGRELIVRDGRYFTVGDNGAEMFSIKKGDIVFNHEQTEALLKNGYISGHGKAYADGTVGGGKLLTPDGHILRPIQPGDRAWDLQEAFKPVLEQWKSGQLEILSNAFFEHQKQMEKWTKEVTNNTAINNITNNRNVQPVVHNHINVTCPGVTEQQVAEHLGSVIGKELDKQFNGFHNYTDQMSRIR